MFQISESATFHGEHINPMPPANFYHDSFTIEIAVKKNAMRRFNFLEQCFIGVYVFRSGAKKFFDAIPLRSRDVSQPRSGIFPLEVCRD
jgi:hypothetical protein